MKRIEALGILAELTDEHPVVVTCAATSRELASLKDSDNHFYLLDAMGLVGSVATGIALDRPAAATKVVGIEGDGSLLMNPNVLPTGGFVRPNMLLILLDNEVYGSTAGLPTYSSRVNLARLAEASGWEVGTATDEDGIRAEFARLAKIVGPTFLHVPIAPGNASGIAKLLVDPVMITARFGGWLRKSNGAHA
ncbi:thiamine pyrophosphate-dependent enzyme [Microbacterium rhizosphaerae]|uniref:Thiamine pyrophosphate-dependent enzyme n=1 Tax=Microbacterium rhizosphaerae TaxID=1678237 RepID=A0ABZ0SM45_9MICO|nr:thiamine pyrophosphate-dependent enzyme [Microbacterium rhizosphaerae]WPR89683.1 thiamine pyrophosphate-dependent enzyme [Microbacterium rhizosphaerae]